MTYIPVIPPSAVRQQVRYPLLADPEGNPVFGPMISEPTRMPTAVFIDAAFFLKRLPYVYPSIDRHDARRVAELMHRMALQHMTQRGDGTEERKALYRIFVYDCPPLVKKAETPRSGQPLDFGKTPEAVFRTALHSELRRLRKVALRLGVLQDGRRWRIKDAATEALRRGERSADALVDADFAYDVRQKGVDMRMGLDIASVTFKKQVDQIVLVAGDADFVPAAKLARREGVDVLLDPMWHPISPDLHEHVDGVRSVCPRPRGQSTAATD